MKFCIQKVTNKKLTGNETKFTTVSAFVVVEFCGKGLGGTSASRKLRCPGNFGGTRGSRNFRKSRNSRDAREM